MSKEPTRHRAVKNTSTKKPPDKATRSTTAEKSTSSQANSNSSIFSSLKRVQGALSPSLKKRSTSKQDGKSVEKDRDKIKDREKVRNKDKEQEKEKKLWFRNSSKVTLRKEPTNSSTASLALGSSLQKVSSVDTKKKRPATVFTDSNVTFRRGQNTKIEGQNLGENLSRTSSVTNLDADPKSGKGARPRKSSSRDRIDKIGENKKNDKKAVTRNNNKLNSGENPYPSVDSLPEEELLHLRKQLQEMAQEKSNLALQLGEQKGQLNILQKEIQKLKEESNIQLDQLTEENTTLRNRLRDVAHSPLSDNEKQQLLFDSHRHHSSAPASIATNIIDDGNGGDTTCTTPDWDKHSSGNVSEVSVACLQDKINQMQETHYSTNEELQATLQELTDLQRQLTELQQENERLNEEKTLMFDSLCRQTERLNDSRSEVESLKQLLYQEKDDTGQFETAVEREQKLVELLKSSQEERESFLLKIEQLNNETQDSRVGIKEKDEQINQLRDRVRTLECTLDAKHAEHKLLDQELAQAKDQCSGKQIEINRLTDLLDNARTKINELEQDRALSDKSELDELLDNARKEKDSLESEVAHLKEQLAISKNEIEKLKEQVSILQEECKVTRNNAKTTQSDLEYKCEKLVKDKNALNEQLQGFQEALNELEVQSKCQLEDKRQLSAVLSETQRNLSETEQKNAMLESEVHELKKQRMEENEEWEKFQDDLLTSVRVANDFKTEAQQDLQRMILENKQIRERERQLKAEIEKLKGGTLKSSNKENQDMDLLIKRPNRKIKERGKAPTSTVPSSTKTDKTPTIVVKRRENKSLKSKRLKTLSIEEELLLSSLNTYHADIDKTIPEEFLTEEQKVIRKLKIIYEDDYLKVKPVAPKAKDQLAISKPLLDSVLTNPKLMEILKNPKVKTVEDMASYEKEAPEIRNIIREIDRSTKGKSDSLSSPMDQKRISIIGRSMSVDQLPQLNPLDTNLKLYRTVETEDLTEESLNFDQRVSSLVPSDSVSNCNKRYSDFAVVVNNHQNKDIFNQNVKYSTLERIVKSIPKNTPESKLNKEQQFALRLLTALEERKNTLKKSDKAKTLPISKPTEESVLKNKKLKEIIYDPDFKDVRRKSDVINQAPKVVPSIVRTSKSCEDITFSFDDKFINMYNSPSDSSLSSAEFNIETNEVGPYNEKSFSNTLLRPLPTPNFSKTVELVTFSRPTSLDNITIRSSKQSLQDAEVIIHKVNVNIVEDTEEVKARDKFVDSLIYNDTLKKKFKDPDVQDKPPLVNDQDDQPALHFAKIETITVSKVDEDDSLNYSDTLERAKQRGPYKSERQEENVNSSPTPDVDKAIENITEKLDQIKKLIDEDKQKLDEINKEKKESDTENTVDDIDGCVDESGEYGYQQILKENRAGVTSPLNYRLSYRGVVKEIKNRFSVDDTFLEESQPETNIEMRQKNTENIDKEMERIFEHYLKTRVSEVIKQTEDKPKNTSTLIKKEDYTKVVTLESEDIDKNDNKLEHEEDKIPPLLKLDTANEESINDFDFSKMSPKELTFSDDSYFELKNGQVTNVKAFEEYPQEESKDVSKEFLSTNSGNLNLYPQKIVSTLEVEHIIENPSKEVTDSAVKQFEEVEVPNFDESLLPEIQTSIHEFEDKVVRDVNELTEEDLDIIRNVKKQTYSRPVSDINDEDLKFIQSLSGSYLTGNEYNEDHKNLENVSNVITEDVSIPKTNENIFEVDTHQDQKIEKFTDEEIELDDFSKQQYHPASVEFGAENSFKDKEREGFIQQSFHLDFDLNKGDSKIINETLSSIVFEADNDLKEKEGKHDIDQKDLEYIDNISKVFEGNNDNIEKARRYTTKFKARVESPSKADADDLETLLGKMSSTRNIVVKKNMKSGNFSTKKGSEQFSSGEGTIGVTNVKYSKNMDKELEETVKSENSAGPALNEAGTIDRNKERHVILYRNRKPENREVRSLHLDKGVAVTSEVLSRWSVSTDKPITKTDKKVKSFARHFERLSLQKVNKPEPIYANIGVLSRTQHSISFSSTRTTEKKPLPVPRAKNQVANCQNDSYSDGRHAVMDKMTEGSKNFSDETGRENVVEEISSTLVNIPKLDGLPSDIEKPKQNDEKLPEAESQNRVLTEDEEEDVVTKLTWSKLGIKKSEKFSDTMNLLPNTENVQEQLDEGGGATSSYSVIAVANTTEKLDLRTPSEVVIHPSNNKTNVSNLNLINLESLETQSFDEPYLNVYKTPEEKLLSELSKQKMGYNITYLGEVSDTESFDDPKLSVEGENNSKPKIVDFVPLDDATKPFFANNNNIPDYNTLEREKVYHVLQTASVSNAGIIEGVEKTADVAKSEIEFKPDNASVKIFPEQTSKVNLAKSLVNIERNPKETLPSTNSNTEYGKKKSSYSAARKVFQELEAKNSIRIASKDIPESESVKSSINITLTGKSTISTESKSFVSDKEVELTQEEIDKEI